MDFFLLGLSGGLLHRPSVHEALLKKEDEAEDDKSSMASDAQFDDPDGMPLIETQYHPPEIAPPLENYKYRPMTNSSENIRILSVNPGYGAGDIEISMNEFQLASRPMYEAISYTWGEPSLCRKVICDGNILHITKILFAALSHFRKPDSTSALWADAICVNQRDNTEKGLQVLLM
jgi:hypothetical protein